MAHNNYILLRKGRFYFNRRVPLKLREFDSRKFIRISLETDSWDIANKRAVTFNEQIEGYWRILVNAGETHSDKKFLQTVQLAKVLGFTYMPGSQLAESAAWKDLYSRLETVEKTDYKSVSHAEALLGGVPPPELTVTKTLDRFWGFTKNRVINKSESMLRKWKNPREKAIRNFVDVVGNKNLSELTRDHIIQFRDWWINRIEKDGLNEASANKDLIHVKNIIETVNENLNLGINTSYLFKKIVLKERFSQARQPFETEFILKTLLSEETLKGLKDQLKLALYALSETGLRPAELTGLLPEDIVLNHKIPHIKIHDRPSRPLKTPHSARVIPLIGYALEAFKAVPKGLTEYFDLPDNLSTELNKFLRDRKVFPSPQHSVYSLRHSFQDRLLSVDTPDRIQAELMGHKFQRPKYGTGPTLEHKLEWMEKIQLKKQG